MSDNAVLAIMAAILRSRSANVQHAAREAVAIGELFGVHASEDTKMELLLGGDAFEQPSQSLPEFIQDMKARV